MTYPPQPGGYDPYGQQQPGYGPQSSGPPYHHDPKTSVPSSPAGGYPQPAYTQGPPPNQPPYGMMSPPQDPGERPQKATIGAMSMVGNAVLWMFSALMSVVFYNQFTSNVEAECKELAGDNSYYSSTSSCTDTLGLSGGQVVGSFFSFVWLLAFVLVALFALRGFNWARITSFALNGVSIAWNLVMMICVGISIAALSSIESSMNTTSSSTSVDDIIPGWYLPSSIIISLLSAVVSVVSIIMMANRESADWYRAHTAARAAGVI